MSVTLYFGTNRNPLGDPAKPADFGDRFSPEGLVDLRFGKAVVSGPRLDRYAIEVATEDLERKVLGSEAIFAEIRARMREEKRDLMLSIHGFDYTFAEALTRTAELARFYGRRDMIWALFTWPSDGSKLPLKAYIDDRDDARASGAALGRGLLKAVKFLRETARDHCGQAIHLMAHSMGNYALRNAVQAMCKESGGKGRRVFDQVLLMAADEDDDALAIDYKLQPVADFARRVTVYHNPGDTALVVSDVTKGNPDRLGANGPRNARAMPDKVSVVNCCDVVTPARDPTGHQYYRTVARVRDDVLSVLDNLDSDRIPGRSYVAETRSYRLAK